MGVIPAEGRTMRETAEASSRDLQRSDTSVLGWNVIVTLPEATAGQARRVLRRWGMLNRTNHFHVLVMTVNDPDRFLREFGEAIAETPGILNFIAHVFPAQRAFDFATVAEFEQKARESVLSWAPVLAGKRFHVRLHRRGLKGVLSTPKEERFLDDALLQAPLKRPRTSVLTMPISSFTSRRSIAALECRCGAGTISGAIRFSAPIERGSDRRSTRRDIRQSGQR
jgi:hypothetical protein